METNQETIVHNLLSFKELTVEVNLVDKGMEPWGLESKHILKIQVLECCGLVDFTFIFVDGTAVRWTFQVKPFVYSILRTKQIAHHYKPSLFNFVTKITKKQVTHSISSSFDFWRKTYNRIEDHFSYLLASYRFDAMHAEKLGDQRVLVLGNMLVITWEHL